MQLKTIFAAATLALAACTFSAAAQSKSDADEMHRAVMATYERQLQEDPTNYQVYFRRANEYYNHNQFSEAFEDINKALEYAPQKEKDIRFQCYSLRASICERMGKYDMAINDLNQALAIDPNNYTTIYQRANIEYAKGDYKAARADYEKLQRLNSRSQEALFGLARVSAAEGNTNAANKYADDAVDLTPAQADVYLHRASIRTQLGNDQGAVDDYLTAINFSNGRELAKPLHALLEMSYTDYDAVNSGLTSAIARSPRQGAYYYIRAAVAQANFKYPAAIADYDYLIQSGLLTYAGIYRNLAECQYALTNYTKGLEDADDAIGSSADNIEAYVVKSDIKRAMGAYSQAVTAADRALAKDANYAPALLAKGIAQLRQGTIPEASTSLGNACLNAPRNPYYTMVRAWALADFQNNADAAQDYYNKVIGFTTFPDTDVRSFKGFAYLYTSRADEANAWMDSVLAAVGDKPAPETYYYAACYYAHAGNADRAFEMMEKALQQGYGDYYRWTADTDARINVEPIRSDARFTELLTRYASIFAQK